MFDRVCFRALVVALAALFLWAAAAAGVSAASTDWWNPDYGFRRKVSPNRGGADYPRDAYAKFWDMNQAREDGGDFRVVDKQGRPAPFAVMFHAKGCATVIAYEVKNPNEEYQVYFGNPRIRAPKQSWAPRSGLFLETRLLEGKQPRNFKQARRFFQKDFQAFGAGYREKIYDALNPYGSSGDFISIFTGYLDIRQPDDYVFASISQDMSVVFIDGRKVCWVPPNANVHAARRGRFNGTIHLDRGAHKVEYLHANAGGRPVMALAWTREGSRDLEICPPTLFRPILGSLAGDLESADGQAAADIDVKFKRSAIVGDNSVELVEAQFTAKGAARELDAAKVEWDFGDGIASSEENPVHIFIGGGLYEVKTAVTLRDGRKIEGSQTIMVSERDDISVGQTPLELSRMVGVLARYPFEKLSPERIEPILPLLRKERYSKELIRAGDAMRRASEQAMDLESIRLQYTSYLKGLRKPDEAREFLVDAIERSRANAARRTQLRYELAKHDLEVAKKPIVALQAIKDIEDAVDWSKVGKRLQWEVAVLKGDCYRQLGEYEKSMDAYRWAERVNPQGDAAIKRSSYGLTVESYLERGELDAAKKALDKWEEQFPTERLFGSLSLLRARHLVADRESEEAIVELETVLRINPRTPYAREIGDLLTKLLIREKDYARALEVLKTLKGRYDDEDFNREIQDRIDTCERRLREK